MTEPMPEPTDARRLLDAIDAAHAEVERLRAQLATTKTPTVHHHASGRVEVEWTDGRGPVIVQPDVIDAWSASVNALVDQVELLRGLLGEALDGWEGNPPVSANARARHAAAIARLRAAGGLT